MKIQTFSIVVGSSACDAHCPFCVSHTTGFDEHFFTKGSAYINEPNFRKAVRLAALGGCTTALLTGKGEPTLYPDQITRYLELLEKHADFPFVELQTNAIRLGALAEYALPFSGFTANMKPDARNLYSAMVNWHKLGLNTIAISVVDVDEKNNHNTYLHHRPDTRYPDLAKTVKFLRNMGFSIRICLMMQKGVVDNEEGLKRVIDWCRDHEVAQFTFRPIRKPVRGADGSDPYMKYIEEFGLDSDTTERIANWVSSNGTHILTLMNGAHEAKVYDVDGQNVCVSDCLTVEPTSDDIRTLIYYPDGRLTYDWQYKGARLL